MQFFIGFNVIDILKSFLINCSNYVNKRFFGDILIQHKDFSKNVLKYLFFQIKKEVFYLNFTPSIVV